MHSNTTFVSVAASMLPAALAGFEPSSSTNVAVYWGQNSAGGLHSQQRLVKLCEKSEVDIIPISFLTSLRNQTLDLASASRHCTGIAGSQLMYCPQVSDDIQKCQKKYGKTILLSLGGATYTEGGFNNAEEAKIAARSIWGTFGSPITNLNLPRPFGAAVVDGFDLDFEDTVANMPAFALELRRLMDIATRRPEIEKYLLTAAPQCVYPDAANHEMLNGVVPFDAVFVQFYNNYCGLDKFDRSSKKQRAFNFQTWDHWARKVSKNKKVKVLLGVPADWSAAGSGFAELHELEYIIAYSKKFESFGGVMMWDASQMEKNQGFLEGVATHLRGPFTKPIPSKPTSGFYEEKQKSSKPSSMLIPPVSNPLFPDPSSTEHRVIHIEDKDSDRDQQGSDPPAAELKEEVIKAHQLSPSELAQSKPPNVIVGVVTKINIPKPEKKQAGSSRMASSTTA